MDTPKQIPYYVYLIEERILVYMLYANILASRGI